MSRIAQEVDEKLRVLDPLRAQRLESLIREVIRRADRDELDGSLCGFFSLSDSGTGSRQEAARIPLVSMRIFQGEATAL